MAKFWAKIRPNTTQSPIFLRVAKFGHLQSALATLGNSVSQLPNDNEVKKPSYYAYEFGWALFLATFWHHWAIFWLINRLTAWPDWAISRHLGAFFEDQRAHIKWLFFERFSKMAENLGFYVVKSLRTVKIWSVWDVPGNFSKFQTNFVTLVTFWRVKIKTNLVTFPAGWWSKTPKKPQKPWKPA